MSTTPSPGTTAPHRHHRAHRLRNFLLPDGREVHIALSPEEAASLRARLETINKDTPFDLVISGSSEHLEALRKAHTHHEGKRTELRARHGDTWDEFERVREDLDSLGSELHMLTDHRVQLDANFSKYGYSAHLRTYDDGHHGSTSSASSFHGPMDHAEKDWEAERRNGRIMKVYKKPTIRQYHHKNLIWRSPEAKEVASFELFVDLLYVGIIAINGDHAAEDPIGYELLRFAVTFIMSWKLWSDISVVVAWLETDDILQRVSVVFIMVCLLGLTTNMLDAFESTWTQLVAFYLAARMFLGVYYLFLAIVIPMVRGMMIAQAVTTAIPSALWIASTFVTMPDRLSLIWIAIFLDLSSSTFVVGFVRRASSLSPRLGNWAERVFEFVPALNIEHRIERTNAFVTLVFGYSVVAIIYQSSAHFGLNSFFGKAALGLVQAFCFNWIYFELDNDIQDIFQHAIRRSIVSALSWQTAHLPFIMSFVIASSALSRIVLTTDCPDARLSMLTEDYMAKSESEVSTGLRWFYCGGLAISLLCMGMISLSHVHKISSCRLQKRWRLLNRFIVCIILLLLPLARSVNSLSLIAIVTSLIVWVLCLELYASSCPHESFFGEKKPCSYTARCRKGKLERAMKEREGLLVDVSELGEKGAIELT